MDNFNSSIKVGIFLASKDIRRNNVWTTALVVFVMSLTFFNMLLMGGLLMGITQGMEQTFKKYYSANIRIAPARERLAIDQSQDVIASINTLETLKAYSTHYNTPAILEYGYKTKLRASDLSETASGTLVGIDPESEDAVTRLSSKIVAGGYLNSTDMDSILVGKDLLEHYSTGAPDGGNTNALVNARVGSKVIMSIGKIQREVVIKGVVNTKNRTVDSRIYMLDREVKNLTGNTESKASEIIIALARDDQDDQVKQFLRQNIQDPDSVSVQTAKEAIPAASADINKTFALLSNIVGVIALVVGAITIFIVIFVNAITRRKYIGILKGIGISSRAIQISYIIQALAYAASGIVLGSIIIMVYLKPYLDLNPISMPISDGSLAVGYMDLFVKGTILLLTALISGFVPAWLVTRQNTLDAILGR